MDEASSRSAKIGKQNLIIIRILFSLTINIFFLGTAQAAEQDNLIPSLSLKNEVSYSNSTSSSIGIDYSKNQEIKPLADKPEAVPVVKSQEETSNKDEKKTTESKNKPVVAYTKKITMTAYTSEVAQCDASPCITANGFNVCKHGIEDTVAANFLPFGTQVRIPELFGDRVFTVRDRMNKRYQSRVDVWMIHKDNAIDFGVKYATIEVLK